MTQSVADIFGMPKQTLLINKPSLLLATDDFIGLEVELERCENMRESELPAQWVAERDGSLRNNGREYKFSQPLFGEDIIYALESLEVMCKDCKPVVTDRCSLHVHLNIKDLSPDELLNLILLYSVCEPAFFSKVAPNRRDNFYCRPLNITDDYLSTINYMFKTYITGSSDYFNFRNRVNSRQSDGLKYSALNVNPISTFGSLEFRHHQGTYKAFEILQWVNYILKLKRISKEMGEISVDFLEDLSCNYDKMQGLLGDIFGEVPEDVLTKCTSKAVKSAKFMLSYSASDGYLRPFNDLLSYDELYDYFDSINLGVARSDCDYLLRQYRSNLRDDSISLWEV